MAALTKSQALIGSLAVVGLAIGLTNFSALLLKEWIMPVGVPAHRELVRQAVNALLIVVGGIGILGRRRIGFRTPKFNRKTTPIIILPGLFVLNGFFWGEWPDSPSAQILVLAGTCICVGFWEEVLFRGVLFELLKPFGKRTVVVWSSVLFGLVHYRWGRIIVIEFAFVVGLTLALSYLCAESIWPGVIFHSMIDFAQWSMERSAEEDFWSASLLLLPVLLVYVYVLIKHPLFRGTNKVDGPNRPPALLLTFL